jgi:hypothetical protein
MGEGGLIPDSAAFAGFHGLYWLTANLAERAPLLLAVDDAHWADEASLRFLIYLLRRIEALPILLVVAARPAEPGDEQALLEPLRNDPLTHALQPAPLSEAAASLIVRAAFSPRADAELCRACQDATGGNPLLLQMLSHALRAEGVDPTAVGGGWPNWRRKWRPRRCCHGCGGCQPRSRRLPAPSQCWATGSSYGTRPRWPNSRPAQPPKPPMHSPPLGSSPVAVRSSLCTPRACRRRCRAAVGLKERDAGGVDGERLAMTIASQHATPVSVTPFYEPL